MRPCRATYGTCNKIPTLLGNDGDGAGDYLTNHPVGVNAVCLLRRPVQLGLHRDQRRDLDDRREFFAVREELRLLR